VAANIVPKDVVDLVTTFNNGDIFEAQKIHFKLLPLIKAMFLETNPIPVKTAMQMMGLCSGELRLPLCPLSDDHRTALKQALKDYGLLKN